MCQVYARSFFASIPLGRGYSTSPLLTGDGGTEGDEVWLVYRHNNQISVVIEPGTSLIHARMRAALANLDEDDFTEGHELDRKWRVPKEMVGVENFYFS